MSSRYQTEIDLASTNSSHPLIVTLVGDDAAARFWQGFRANFFNEDDVLGAVKTEFGKFGDVLARTRKRASNAEGNLWRIERKGVPASLLFAVLHDREPPLMPPLPAPLLKALANARLLAFEIDRTRVWFDPLTGRTHQLRRWASPVQLAVRREPPAHQRGSHHHRRQPGRHPHYLVPASGQRWQPGV